MEWVVGVGCQVVMEHLMQLVDSCLQGLLSSSCSVEFSSAIELASHADMTGPALGGKIRAPPPRRLFVVVVVKANQTKRRLGKT